MDNQLSQVLDELGQQLEEFGYSVKDSPTPGKESSYSVDIDGNGYVGTVFFWSDKTFEFQFNSAESGKVAVLETREFTTYSSLKTYLVDLLFNRLS